MTAEERLAYFQGEKRRVSAVIPAKNEKNVMGTMVKIKFIIAVILFIIFLSMDYTGAKFYGIGSTEIVEEFTTDWEYLEKFTL